MAPKDLTSSPAPLHLLHVFPSFGIGGMPLRTVRVMQHLGIRCRHTVVSLDGTLGAGVRIPAGIEAALVPMSLDKRRVIGNLIAFRRFLARLKPDLLLTHNWGAIEWAAVNRVRPVCRHIHFEAGFHRDEAASQFRRRILARRFALAGAERVVVPSRALERIAIEVWHLPRAQVLYVPDGIDVDRFVASRRTRLPADDTIVIGTVAPLRPEKNIGRLIDRFRLVAADPRLRLVIAGDGPDRAALEALAARLDLTERVSFLGQVERPELLLPDFDLFALSSDTEQIPNAVIEAMAAALPIVSVDVGDVAIMVADENRRFVVPRDNEEAFAASIRTLAGGPSLRQELGAANRRKAESHYRQELMFQQYESLIMGEARPARGLSAGDVPVLPAPSWDGTAR